MLTYALAAAVIDHLLRNQAHTPPTTIYLGLLTAVANAQSPSVTEVSGGAYARQAVTLSAASNGTTSNSADVTYATATASWGTVTHVALFTASSGGTAYWVSDALATPKTISSGDQAVISTGAATFTP